MRRVIKQLTLILVLSIIFSACGQGEAPVEADYISEPEPYVAAVEPEPIVEEAPIEETPVLEWWETHYRIIPGEPEENVENHITHHGTPLYLRKSFYGESITVEYYTCDGGDRPAWSTLLLYKNDRVYPLHSVQPNRFVWSITGARFYRDEGYVIWVQTFNTGGHFMFWKYTYDFEKDAFIETIMYSYHTWTPVYRFNVCMDRTCLTPPPPSP